MLNSFQWLKSKLRNVPFILKLYIMIRERERE
jgi:hypothetical protein